jgi:hypothetical protein
MLYFQPVLYSAREAVNLKKVGKRRGQERRWEGKGKGMRKDGRGNQEWLCPKAEMEERKLERQNDESSREEGKKGTLMLLNPGYALERMCPLTSKPRLRLYTSKQQNTLDESTKTHI